MVGTMQQILQTELDVERPLTEGVPREGCGILPSETAFHSRQHRDSVMT
jgi:hypothetical protein